MKLRISKQEAKSAEAHHGGRRRMKIVLASASPRRQELLTKIIPDFEIRVIHREEILEEGKSAALNAQRLAREKANAAWLENTQEIIIGCDTLGEVGGELLGKPSGKNEAVEMLKKLSGTTHTIATGYCVKTAEKEICGVEIAEVTFRKLSEAEIKKYVAENPVEGFAGSYAIQEIGDEFVEKISGEFEVIVGFPMTKMREILEGLRIQN
jgi:septum formation protein